MITPDQVDSIKTQLIKHVEGSFPEDKKQFAIEKINSMDASQLESFLKQNQLIQKDQNLESANCVFCSIISGDISSYKIAENNESLAVLEINPLSKGHSIIIPKQHITNEKDVNKSSKDLAKDISKIIKSKLKPKEVIIESSNIMGHEIINIIPIYEGQEGIPKERHQAKPEELIELQNKLKKSKTIKRTNKPKSIKTTKTKIYLPKRIP